jgi:hypothetical protein
VNASRYFIRLFRGGISNWLTESPTIPQLAKAFDLGETENSVYEVGDGEEEWLAAGAHVLANPKQGADAISVLRIHEEHLRLFGISVDRHQLGTTGFVWADHRHRNLCAGSDRLIELVEFLAGRCSRGHDLVRRVEKPHVERSLQRICAYPTCRCPPHITVVARYARKETDRLVLDLAAVRSELLAVEFDDDVILPRAASCGSGDQPRDWFEAVKLLRIFYADHYVPALAKRFGLH